MVQSWQIHKIKVHNLASFTLTYLILTDSKDRERYKKTLVAGISKKNYHAHLEGGANSSINTVIPLDKAAEPDIKLCEDSNSLPKSLPFFLLNFSLLSVWLFLTSGYIRKTSKDNSFFVQQDRTRAQRACCGNGSLLLEKKYHLPQCLDDNSLAQHALCPNNFRSNRWGIGAAIRGAKLGEKMGVDEDNSVLEKIVSWL